MSYSFIYNFKLKGITMKNTTMWQQINMILMVTIILVFGVCPIIEQPAEASIPTAEQSTTVPALPLSQDIKMKRYASTPEQLIDEAIANGGILVQCHRNKCYDTATSQFYGESKKDGYYLLFPKTNKSAVQKLQEISEQLSMLEQHR